MSVKAIPEGYYTVTPYLIVKDPAQAIRPRTKRSEPRKSVDFPTPAATSFMPRFRSVIPES